MKLQSTLTLLLLSFTLLWMTGCTDDQPIITIYGSNQCHHCIDLKKSLDSANMEYTFYDIDVDDAYAQEMFDKLQKANMFNPNIGLPVVEINEEKMLVSTNFQKVKAAVGE